MLGPVGKKPEEITKEERERIQMPSGGGLLEQIKGRRFYLTRVPIFGWLERKIVYRTAKQDYINKHFANNPLLRNQLRPLLMKLSVDDLPYVVEFLKSTKGMLVVDEKTDLNALVLCGTQFMKIAKEANLTGEEIQKYRSSIFSLIQQGKGDALLKSFSYLPTVSRLLDRLQPKDKFDFFGAMIESAENLEPEKFTKFTGDFGEFLRDIDSRQERRPLSYPQSFIEIGSLRDNQVLFLSNYPNQSRKLRDFMEVMIDVTVPVNTQILQYNIAGFYFGPFKTDHRTIPFIEKRVGGVPFSLFNEQNIQFVLPKEDDKVIDFNFSTKVFISDATGATRSVIVPLPFSGTMTVGEARKKLEFLYEFLGDPRKFEEHYKEAGLPETEQKDEIKKNVFEFCTKAEKKLAEAIGNFNASLTQPKDFFVRQEEKIKIAIAKPESEKAAVEAAKLANVFVLEDGTLSLLPVELARKHQQIATFSKDELNNITRDRTTSLAFHKGAELSLEFEPQTILGTPVLLMKTTIKVGENKHTRTSYYRAENKEPGDVQRELFASNLFERDLLLAKAEYMEHFL